MTWKLSRLVTLGALVAAVAAVPALGASEAPASKLVQIGGQLVPPSQLSSWQSHAGQPVSQSSQRVQIGGRLVPAAQLSSTEHQLSASWLAANGSNGGGSHIGRNVGIGFGVAAFVAAMLVMVGVLTPRRQHSLTPA